MQKKESSEAYTILVSDSYGNKNEKGTYEVAFRRWLVRELDASRITVSEAIKRFNFHPVSGNDLIRSWRKRYASDIAVTLPAMTQKERQKLEELQKKMKQMEKQLEDTQMKNIALETMIDVAEEQLKISIRKKSGPKQ
jgi:Skp family chaperone for outer membrane proteins